jgi:glycosyltransferase involved in cell wall biosynthesis
MYAPSVGVVVPCYNEQDAIPATHKTLTRVVRKMVEQSVASAGSVLVFVDDGSSDRTWETIRGLRRAPDGPGHPLDAIGVRLASNAGHQAAIVAGMQVASARCDVIVTIDADLQDDPESIVEMVRLCNQGCEVVLGVRMSRHTDSWFKRTSARTFYRFMNIMGVPMVQDHADFRAMTRPAVERLMSFPERNLFLRAVVPTISNRVGIVRYARAARVAGESKYPLRKMLSFAWRGITANSIAPLRMVLVMGLITLVLSIGGICYAVAGYLSGSTIPGWLSLVVPQFFIGGMVMLAQSIVGEYLARIYVESKRRPHFFIAEVDGAHETALSSSTSR